jgi:hypothetical protein
MFCLSGKSLVFDHLVDLNLELELHEECFSAFRCSHLCLILTLTV